MATEAKEISNPFSTGGGGTHFEADVQASFLVLMLTKGYIPCLYNKIITKIRFQGKFEGYNIDDMIIFSEDILTNKESKLLAQIKHSITISENNKTFQDVIKAAWDDFNSKKFVRNNDKLALITGPLSITDIEDVRTILEWSRNCENYQEFFLKVEMVNFSSDGKRNKLKAFKENLKKANNDLDVSQTDLFDFLRHFYLLGYDLDIKSGIVLSLLFSLIGQYTNDRVIEIWTLLVNEAKHSNKNAGVITRETLPENILSVFDNKKMEVIPEKFTLLEAMEQEKNWNHDKNSESILFANIIGSWDEKNYNDQKVYEKLSKREFSKWLLTLQEIIQESNNPLILRSGKWKIKDRTKLWEQFLPRIFDNTIDEFKNVAIEVLAETDPALDLPKEERYMAILHNKIIKHSYELRKGIVETIVLLSIYDERFLNTSRHKAKNVVDLIVKELFTNSDWKIWCSLNELIPTIAEASPDSFLNVVNSILIEKPQVLKDIFEQESNGISGRNYMTGLLWALESLAWNKELLPRVLLILCEIAEIDLGGKWANRADNSIVSILLPWLPQTMSSYDTRIGIINSLKNNFPRIIWKVIIKLLPNQHQMSMGTNKPKWKNIIPENWKEEITNDAYFKQIKAFSDIAVELAKTKKEWLIELIDKIDQISEESALSLLNYIFTNEITGVSDDEKVVIWKAIKKMIKKYKRYEHVKGRFNLEVLLSMEKIEKNISPKKIQYIYQDLFSNSDHDFYETGKTWEEQSRELEEKRKEIIENIFSEEGILGVLDLVGNVENPRKVGLILGNIENEETLSFLIDEYLATDETNFQKFFEGYILGKIVKNGYDWLKLLKNKNWNNDDKCRLLLCLPFEKQAWDYVSNWLSDDEKKYWEKVNINPYWGNGKLDFAIDKLIEYGRPLAALYCIYVNYHQNNVIDEIRATKALICGASSKETAYISAYEIVEVIKQLQKSLTIDGDSLFRVEWTYLNILDEYNNAKPVLLEKYLSNDPEFFSEIIRLIYRSKKESISNNDEKRENIAINAWKLLNCWKKIPGIKEDSELDIEFLNKWIEKVREKCDESGHLDVALIHIGRVLFYSPADKNGLWINEDIAKILDDRDAEILRRNFCTEAYNSRGAHFIDESGNEERKIAEYWKERAEVVEKHGYIRFAITLKKFSESYENEADRIVEMYKNEID